MNCELCNRANIKNHYRCTSCHRWVGNCCLALRISNVCVSCHLDQHDLDDGTVEPN